MNELQFEVQGSAAEPYEVVIKRRDEQNLSAYCSCPAGQNGMHCKHRIGILIGKPKGVVGDRADDLKTIETWVDGSDIASSLFELNAAEAELESLKSKVKKLKKTLAKAMLD